MKSFNVANVLYESSKDLKFRQGSNRTEEKTNIYVIYIIKPNMKISSIAISISQSGFPFLWCFYRVEKPPQEQVQLPVLRLEQVQTLRVQRGWDSIDSMMEISVFWERMSCLWFYHILSGWWFQNIFFLIFIPKIGEMIQCDEHIFQMGWFKHQRMLWLFNISCFLWEVGSDGWLHTFT